MTPALASTLAAHLEKRYRSYGGNFNNAVYVALPLLGVAMLLLLVYACAKRQMEELDAEAGATPPAYRSDPNESIAMTQGQAVYVEQPNVYGQPQQQYSQQPIGANDEPFGLPAYNPSQPGK
ncbi:hypothetical protein BCR33DRAFT_716900 [Rhizoclosmatium globosum]|uniref:Uncharacterized protein n=1 Tax=Rhizoclosmatium globosum TaxID=329046 RepID=A0A1Y2CBD6_9FUNG|nr:hypothetical protein HDU79_002048 [Rhizoclosmatium sp. JEL0117]KAJ3291767.1 hypothetical protein HDU79_002050 [Rhizoclosmatium sp. JEL0117]ORY44343.1 hypothetical protein BCR33DRAFT_716900 [Rhizoclosmatium globosum]|eukprot:ORY44343.1 hypothetical protein BCR33DRAFT_716900 [Rhizoclosmatium globosum]